MDVFAQRILMSRGLTYVNVCLPRSSKRKEEIFDSDNQFGWNRSLQKRELDLAGLRRVRQLDLHSQVF